MTKQIIKQDRISRVVSEILKEQGADIDNLDIQLYQDALKLAEEIVEGELKKEK